MKAWKIVCIKILPGSLHLIKKNALMLLDHSYHPFTPLIYKNCIRTRRNLDYLTTVYQTMSSEINCAATWKVFSWRHPIYTRPKPKHPSDCGIKRRPYTRPKSKHPSNRGLKRRPYTRPKFKHPSDRSIKRRSILTSHQDTGHLSPLKMMASAPAQEDNHPITSNNIYNYGTRTIKMSPYTNAVH
jgi:hypothetical protein